MVTPVGRHAQDHQPAPRRSRRGFPTYTAKSLAAAWALGVCIVAGFIVSPYFWLIALGAGIRLAVLGWQLWQGRTAQGDPPDTVS